MPDSEQSLFFRFFNESSEAMALADMNGMMLRGNAAFRKMVKTFSGDSSSHLSDDDISPSSFDFLSIHDSVRLSNFVSRLQSGKERSLEFRAAFHDAQDVLRWLHISLWLVAENPAAAAEERGPFIAFTLEDETEEQQHEDKLVEEKNVAEKAADAKSRFLAVMSHEIRTPIQTIIGMTELLRETRLDREQKEYARQVDFSAEVLLALINDILDYSKIEAGKMELERAPFDAAAAVEQAVLMISIEAHKKGLEIASDIASDARLMMLGDGAKFRQVIINLAKNAVKFTERGGVTVAMSQSGGWLTVEVIDTGIGISEEGREKLFNSFTQADVSHSRKYGGTGLGLAISKEIVELMGGEIGAKPNPAGGSIFYFSVPAELADIPVPRIEQLPAELCGLRVLLTDDADCARESGARYLRALGANRVETAVSGDETLARMRAAAKAGDPFALCFLDMTLPLMDGWRLAAEINNDKEINSARLVLGVPRGMLEADAKMTLLQWFDAYADKPSTLESLRAAFVAAIEKKEGEVPADLIDGEEGAGETKAELRQFSGVSVLVVEDYEVNRSLFVHLLGTLGIQAEIAADGIEALEKMRAADFDIVFMDLQMPRMNGFEAAQELRRRGCAKPLVACTASVLEEEQQQCRACGFDDILFKPFKRGDVELVLKKYCGAPSISSAPQAAASPQSSSEVFSEKDLLETFMGDAESAKLLLKKFVARSAEQIAALPALEKARDWEEARRIAHTLKGSAANLSGKNCGETAARLEKLYRSAMLGAPPDFAAIAASRAALDEAFGGFKAAAEKFLG